MRNMKNSTLEEPIIHLIIWIRNEAIMNEEDDEAEGLLEQGPTATGKAAILADRQFGKDEEIR